MPRIARVVAVGYPHHITQRGNYQQSLFENDDDRIMYLSLVKAESVKRHLRILAYCLMSNHVHFIAVPDDEDSMALTFKYAHMKYSQAINKRNGLMGHLFQGRFYSCVMDERYTGICARYIERNPVRAGMVKIASEWEWSSARFHCGEKGAHCFHLDQLFDFMGGAGKRNWAVVLAECDSTEEMLRIKQQTRHGRPLGNEVFFDRVESILQRELVVKTRGRPKLNGKK
ncbi:MAG: transposase [Candidatus Omnitrophica bacterium]|nr:transposase [Candidatus Omnitrophota bacterium]